MVQYVIMVTECFAQKGTGMIMTDKTRIITPDDNYHYFFAYYDLQPYSGEGGMHLSHRVSFADRLPQDDDIAQLGYIQGNSFVGN